MTTNKPEVVAWGNDPRNMSEEDLLPCPNCNHRAGKATRRAAKGLPFVGLWKVSCQRSTCPLAMIYFHPVEWNRLPRIRQSEYAALQAKCEKLRNLLRHAQPIIRAHAEASHMLEGFRPRRNQWDELVEGIDTAMQEAAHESH